jgi:hypothetical protein
MSKQAERVTPAEDDDWAVTAALARAELLAIRERNTINRMIAEMLYPVVGKPTPAEQAERHAVIMDFVGY